MASRLGHRPALDGLRGVAIFAVVAYHYFKLPGGWLGVDLFFVLSGFLITTLLLEERDWAGRVSLRRFYIRRARRLLPALGGLLVFVSVFGPISYGSTRTFEMLGVSAGYVVNFTTILHHTNLTNYTPISHLWSLSEEEQFYFVWPTVLLILLRCFTERRSGAILAALFVALVLYRGLLIEDGASWVRVYFSPDTHADGLVLGCAAAIARRHGLRVGSGCTAAALVVLVCAFKMAAHNNFAMEFGLPVFEIGAAAAVLGAVTADGPIGWILSRKPLTWLGAISYSLYLWHQPARWLTGWTHTWLALVLAMPLTLGSYYIVERPFRRRRVPARWAIRAL